MKNNAIFAKKRLIVHQMWVKNSRFGKVSRILPEGESQRSIFCRLEQAFSPPNRSTDGEVVGVGDSVHFACYRSHVAGTEDIINANTERTFLIGVAQLAKTALQKAITHTPTNLAIHIRQRYGIEVTHRQHRVGRLVNRRFHRLRLLLA